MLSTAIISPILVGAVLNLDKQVFGQFMLGRPLMVGFFIGLIIGDLEDGIWMGLSAELLWLAALPLGGQLTPNAGLAVTATLTAWVNSCFVPAVGGHDVEAGLVISFLTLPLWAHAFTIIDKISRRLVPPQLAVIYKDINSDRNPQLFKRNIYGLWWTLALSIIAVTLAVIINIFILNTVGHLVPEIVLSKLGDLFPFIPFLGLLGMAVNLEAKNLNVYLGAILVGLLALSAVH